MKKIGFIGAGKVGFSFGRHIYERAGASYSVVGYYSNSPESANAAALFAGGKAFNTVNELAEECDLLLLTVPDGQIADAWISLKNKIESAPIKDNKQKRLLCIGHCSGLYDSNIFERPTGQTRYEYAFGSIHPIMAIHDKETAYQKLQDSYFTIEGDAAFIDFTEDLLANLKNPFSTIDADFKTLYHAASVMVSNLVCALTYEGIEVFKACGLDDEFAENAWRSLFLGNANNIASLGPVLALTGPMERADITTIKKHLDALSGDARDIYLSLSRVLIETAQLKNPDRDYSELRKLLCPK